MPGKITPTHNSLVQIILDTVPGAKAIGFWSDHDALCERLNLEGGYRQPFRPDAHRFNPETSEIEIYEVEVRSRLTPQKIAMLGDLWEWWDGEEEDWLPVLFVVDRFGSMSRLDLRHAAFGTGWAA